MSTKFGRRRLAAVLALLAMVAAACSSSDDSSSPSTSEPTTDVQEGGSITYAAEQEPTGFNNLTSKDNLLELRHIMRHVWPYAYKALPDFSVEPTPTLTGPATVVTEDPFTVEWSIAPEAAWDDDVPVTSDDFLWQWESCNGKIDEGEPTTTADDGSEISALDCAQTSGYDVSTFNKVDDKTFQLVFEQPYVEYEGLFGDPLPPAHIGRTREGGWNSGFDADPGASAGPYKLKEWVKGKHIILERNDKYWGPKPHLDTIIFLQVPDPAAHLDALRNDEVQVVYPQPQVDLLQTVESIPGINHEVNFGPTWEHLDFNFKNELLAQLEVRQAIAYGIDRDRYVATLMAPFSDKAERLDNRVYMSNDKNYQANGAEYATRDVDKATAKLEGAGFTKGADGVYAKDGKRLSFRLRVKSPNPLREQLEQLIQADLAEVGIEVKIDNFSEPDSIGSVGVSGDFDLFIFAWVGTPFPISGTEQVFASTSDSNFGKYNNPEFDTKIKEISVELDADKRVTMLNELDAALWEDLPNIPLFQKPAGLLAYSDKYANIVDNTTSEGFFWNSETWGLKAAAA